MKNTHTPDNIISDPSDATNLRQQGASALCDLKGAILGSIVALHENPQMLAKAQNRSEQLVRAHLARLTEILEASHGESSDNVHATNPGNSLDLDAARREIRSRLVKLAEQRGG